MAAVEKDLGFPTDVAKMTKMQKLATLMIMLGPDSAAQILKNLDEADLESVCSEMTKVNMISQEMQVEILKEFSEIAVHASTAIRGGIDFTQSALEKGLGLFRAANVISRVSPGRAPLAAMQQIVDLEAREIFNLIKHEQPQTIALITSYLPSDKASQVFSMLRGDLRDQVIERLATMAQTPVEVVEKIVDVINAKLGGKQTRALNQTGGIKATADLLNALDKNLSKTLLISLEERNPELGQQIRQKMFTFEDLNNLDVPSLQKVMREVDMRDLAIALKTASEQLKASLMGCISKRAAETVGEEMSFMGPLKLRDIEAAQLRIIDVVRRLEGEGEIDVEGKERPESATA